MRSGLSRRGPRPSRRTRLQAAHRAATAALIGALTLALVPEVAAAPSAASSAAPSTTPSGAVRAAKAPAIEAGPSALRGAVTRTYTMTELAAAVPVAPPMMVGYQGVRSFIPAAVANKKDARGCNLRQRMIIDLATKKPRIGAKCRMTGGTWVVDGGAKTVRSPKGLVLTPAVPYASAWGHGAYAWTPAQRLAWATNTGATSPAVRAKSVTTQATQSLVSQAFVNDVVARVRALEEARFVAGEMTWKIQRFLAGCLTLNGTDCIRIAVALTSSQEIRDAGLAFQAAGTAVKTACETLGGTLANLKAWGLAMDADLAAAITGAVQECNDAGVGVTVTDMTAATGITAVVPAAATPATYVPDSDPLFSGYGTPVTKPATRLFGVLAPVDWGDPQVSVDSLRLWDAGVSWRQVEVAKGTFDWTKLDATIAMAQRLGARVQYVLGDTPGWANGGKAGSVPPTELADAARFISQVCTRYKGSIEAYEVWNEGNIVEFWSGSPEQLADLTGLVYSAVQACHAPSVVIASSAGARATGGLANRYMPYLKALKAKADAQGGAWPIEAVEVHSYPAANGTPVERVGILQQWSAMLDANGVPPTMPRYDGELNYGLAGLGQARVPIGGATGAAWLAQSYIQSMQYGIDTLHWFLWTGSRGDYDKLGIQFNTATDEVKQAWTTTRSWLQNSRMQRCAQRDNLMACQLTSASGANATLAWTVDGKAATLNTTGLGTQVCTLAGTCTPVGATSAIQVNGSPVRIS